MNPVPSLAELAADPARAAALPPEAARALLTQLAALREALRLRVVAAPVDGEQLIGADEFGKMLGRSRSWVEQHVDELPPRRSLLGVPVWIRTDVERWIRGLPKYGE